MLPALLAFLGASLGAGGLGAFVRGILRSFLRWRMSHYLCSRRFYHLDADTASTQNRGGGRVMSVGLALWGAGTASVSDYIRV